MKTSDVQVYDNYLDLFNKLLGLARAIQDLPLDGMHAVLGQVAEAGCYNAHGHTLAVGPEAVAQHRVLVDAALAFRETVADTITPRPAPPTAETDQAATADPANTATGGPAAG